MSIQQKGDYTGKVCTFGVLAVGYSNASMEWSASPDARISCELTKPFAADTAC